MLSPRSLGNSGSHRPHAGAYSPTSPHPRAPTDSHLTGENQPRDYVAVAVRYAREAARDDDGTKHGRWTKLAARRFLTDLARAKRETAPFRFSPWHANDACGFIEKLPHVEGKWETETLTLHAAHVFFVVQLFGFRDERGGRRFTSALMAIARKNAKSTIVAALLLYCLCCEDEVGAQVITAATTGQQARVVFNIAKRMVEQTPDLREAFTLEPFANAIARWQAGGSLKPINAKASTQDGLNPSHTAMDEIHAHKTHDLINVLQSAAGARWNPLWLYTTTEGYETPGPWPELRNFAQRTLDRSLAADHFLAVIFAVDDEDDEFDERCWVKANPLIEVNPVLLQQIRSAAVDAKAMPGRLAEFRIKRLNRRSAAARSWIDVTRWNQCGGAVNLDELAKHPCHGGLDLASTRDLCALRLVWLIDDTFYTWGMRWCPENSVAYRTERGTAPYAGWVQQGLIKMTPGDATDYSVIERDIEAVKERFPLLADIAFDPWNATDLVARLMEKNFMMVSFRQGPKSYHPAMQALELAYLARKVAHAGDPVLAWCAANLVPRYDENMNMAPDKKRSADKIDDMTAFLMAFDRARASRGQAGIGGWLNAPAVVVGTA